MQATFWTAQLVDGTKMRGGQSNLFSDDVNVSAVPTNAIKVFTILHNTYAHTYYRPWNTWYKDGKVWIGHTYPQQYTMRDGSILTVDFDEITGLLVLTQV